MNGVTAQLNSVIAQLNCITEVEDRKLNMGFVGTAPGFRGFFALKWHYQKMHFNEITENELHLLLLFYQRLLILGFNSLVALVARYGLMIRGHCDRCSLKAVVGGCCSIPVHFDISFIMFLSVVVPKGALHNQILSSPYFSCLLVSEGGHLKSD